MKISFQTDPGPHKINVLQYIKELFALDNEIFNKPPIHIPFAREEQLLQFLTQDHTTTTIIWNNSHKELVGYLSYEEDPHLTNLTELVNFGVRPKFQHQGYGSTMLKYYLELFKDKDSRLVSHPNNIPAQKLYKKYGYIPVKIVKDYFGDGEPRLLLFRRGGI